MKNFVAYVRSILSNRLFLNVLAEEPTPTPTPDPTPTPEPKPSGNVNFEDLIAKARKDERDKLYGEIEKLKKKANDHLLVIQERDNTIADLNGKLTKLGTDYKRVSDDLATGTKTNKTVSELTATVSTLERELENLQVQYETDVQSLKIDAFKKESIAKAGGEIIPELVNGSTEDEITQSIELAKQRYAQITQQALAGVQMPRVNPSAQIELKDMSMDDIAGASTKDWAEMRKSLGLK
jgi:hypothetical protein